MPLFLITFLSLYGGINLYVLFRIRSAYSPPPTISILLSAWLLLMTLAPLMVRLAETSGWVRVAAAIAWPGYIWMGCVFLLGTTLAATDLLRAGGWLLHRWTGMPASDLLNSRFTCSLALIIALAASLYALYEARHIRTDQVTLTTDKLPPSVPSLRIVQISDVHVGILFRERRLQAVLDEVRSAEPDLLVSTGDLVDGRLSLDDVGSGMDRMAQMMAAAPARLGKYAVTGNHEFYAGLNHALDFTQKAGFTILRDRCVTLEQGISICGVDDAAGRGARHQEKAPPEAGMLDTIPSKHFTALLKHRPIVTGSPGRHYDLQLSGHVHKGQLFPFNLLVRLKFPIPAGTSSIEGGSTIHVSRGSGTWGPPMRLFAPPEVTVIDIRSRPSDSRP